VLEVPTGVPSDALKLFGFKYKVLRLELEPRVLIDNSALSENSGGNFGENSLGGAVFADPDPSLV
jgi:hypothetical protein